MVSDSFQILQGEALQKLYNSIASIDTSFYLRQAKTKLDKYNTIFEQRKKEIGQFLESPQFSKGLADSMLDKLTFSDVQGSFSDITTEQYKKLIEDIYGMKQQGSYKSASKVKAEVEGSVRYFLERLRGQITSESKSSLQNLQKLIDNFLGTMDVGAEADQKASALGTLYEALITVGNEVSLSGEKSLAEDTLQIAGSYWLTPEKQQEKNKSIKPGATDVIHVFENGGKTLQIRVSLKLKTATLRSVGRRGKGSSVKRFIVGNIKRAKNINYFFSSDAGIKLDGKIISDLEEAAINCGVKLVQPTNRGPYIISGNFINSGFLQQIKKLSIINSVAFIFLGKDWESALQDEAINLEKGLKDPNLSLLPDVIGNYGQMVYITDAFNYIFSILERIVKGENPESFGIQFSNKFVGFLNPKQDVRKELIDGETCFLVQRPKITDYIAVEYKIFMDDIDNFLKGESNA